jgi:hypothetical protein
MLHLFHSNRIKRVASLRIMGQVLVPLTFTIVGTFPAFIALCCNTERNKENRIIKIGSVYVKAAERLREKVKKNVPFCRVSLRQRSILSNTVRYTLHCRDSGVNRNTGPE